MLPMIHHPTFDPEKELVVTLAVAGIGAKYTGLPGAQPFSKALFELNHRLILFMSERERQFVRTEAYLTAQLLQAAHGYLSDNERTFELAEACRSSITYHAKCMGLFRTETPSEPDQDGSSLEESWHAWIRQERRRRIAWSIYELDTSSGYLHNNRPLLSPEELNLNLPSSSQHWEAPSAHAWAALHPWANACPPTSRLRPLIRSLFDGTEKPAEKFQDEKQRFLVILALVRTLLSVKDLQFTSTLERDQDGFESKFCNQKQHELLQAIDCFYESPAPRAKFYTRTQLLQAAYRTQLTHVAHLYGAGDLMTFLYPYLRNGQEAENAKIRMLQWAQKDQRRVRNVAYHSAQILALLRKYPSNLPVEPFVVFHAGVVLSCMAKLLPACQTHGERRSLQIDYLGEDDNLVRKALAWVHDGGDIEIRLHGVPSLCCEKGRKEVLDQTAELLRAMSVWSISQNFAAMILSLRQNRSSEHNAESAAALTSVGETIVSRVAGTIVLTSHRLGRLGTGNKMAVNNRDNCFVNKLYVKMSDSLQPFIETPSPSIVTLRTSSSETPSRRTENRRIGNVMWLQVGRKANKRRGISSSYIWQHGDEYCDISKPDDSAS
ncbi:uncharacterized protein A1O5_13074 [Cladophialophora psammophila CBS 110553]|uniref:Xylanolytic transcriptional activator regulatory domain-containing protein n=1 Tax=Cladophialophora psammophila CBS 110553 TaxID=1182543 RepID=W9VDS3_9EURO|nr:uncharacterized protein A1O5_13074 [Cladophialophora psammophila CBS 110553]EXJ53623.1 hypothetical protein A1O5_13074 [Cladophialophora psammophila CBS 110553]